MAVEWRREALGVAGDTIRIRTPGGGYGDPAKRDPKLTKRDRERGYLNDPLADT